MLPVRGKISLSFSRDRIRLRMDPATAADESGMRRLADRLAVVVRDEIAQMSLDGLRQIMSPTARQSIRTRWNTSGS